MTRLLVLAGIVPLLAGCLSCEPLLEVRNCLDHQCVPSDDAVDVRWDADLAAAWPDIDALLRGVPDGDHGHRAWDRQREAALWDAFGVAGDEPELIVITEDGRFRVRVLTCD